MATRHGVGLVNQVRWEAGESPLEGLTAIISAAASLLGGAVTVFVLMSYFVEEDFREVFLLTFDLPLLGTTYPILSLLLMGTIATGVIGTTEWMSHRMYFQDHPVLPFLLSSLGFISLLLAAGEPFVGVAVFGIVSTAILWVVLYAFKRQRSPTNPNR